MNLGLLALAVPLASACENTRRDNLRVSRRLGQEAAQLAVLEGNLLAMDSACQKTEMELSGKLAKGALGESCHALRESAQLQEKLTAISARCSKELTVVHESMQHLTEAFVYPGELALEASTKLDSQLSMLQQICGNELAKTRALRDDAKGLLARSQAAVLRAKTDGEKFTKLGVATGGFQKVSQAAADHCTIDDASAPAGKVGVASAPGNGGPARSPASAGGKSPRTQSTITGEPEAARKERQGQAIINGQ